jgi:formylglycine-generating enzyme required for sulfatase activity
MKYEISQGQYKDFLNTLTYAQQASRTANAPTSAAGTGALINPNADRNGIDIQTPGNATTLVPAVYGCNLDADANYNETVDGEWIACNLLLWPDGAAYLDWAGLRLMTELEFEKACRGNQAAVADEYAWGNTTTTSANNITNSGEAGEVTNTANANSASASTVNVQGPLRVGAFAGAATTRAQAGATYYGIMEMSGNMWERAVSIGHTTGRDFTGVHGNGSLSNSGNATSANWPGLSSGQVINGTGSGYRGGMFNNFLSETRVSDRIYASVDNPARLFEYGGRGVRTAQ